MKIKTMVIVLLLLLTCGGTAAAKEVEYTIDYGDYIGVIKVDTMEVLSKETLPWTGEGCGIHYNLTFAVSGETIYNITVGDNLLTRNNEDPILEDRWCTITVDDGRKFSPGYTDYYAGWSPERQEASRGVTTCGVFEQPIPEGIAPGHTVTIEVWQRATTLQDILQPQINCYYVVDPQVGDPNTLVYGLVVFDDNQGKEVYLDEPFYPSKAAPNLVGQFTDVLTTDYYAEPVQWAVENGITSGTSITTFSPNQVCTRAQAMTFLWKAAGMPEPVNTSNPFQDVQQDTYYYKAVLWAVENDITSGTGAATFSPNQSCTRGQIMMFLYKAAGAPSVSGSSGFWDVETDTYFFYPVLWAVQNDITSGTSATTFSPNQSCTRAQIVTFLYRHYA